MLEKQITWYMNYFDFKERKVLKHMVIIFGGLILLTPLLTFMHEWGHLIAGSLLGFIPIEFVSLIDTGYVKFLPDAVLFHDPIRVSLLGFSGGLSSTIVLLLMAQAFYKGGRILILSTLPYGIWEMGQCFLYAIYTPQDIYLAYMTWMEPVQSTGIIILFIVSMWQMWKWLE